MMGIDIRDIDNEKPLAEHSEKKWLAEKVNAMKQRIENNAPVDFCIKNITSRGFVARSLGLSAIVPFSNMPWRYPKPNFWKVIFPSLVEKYFVGYVSRFKEDTLSLRIQADCSQFDSIPFQYEIDEVYTAIVLKKTNSCLWLDFGYGFQWERGSLPMNMAYHREEDDVDLFPYYNPGDKFKVLCVGKSVAGNDIFSYDGTRYYSEEHRLVGQKIWVNLERTKSGTLRFITEQQYIGELVLDEEEEYWKFPREIMQKTLQTLPEGQRLWCKVVDIAFDGTLQLKWLVDVLPPIEDVLSLYADMSVLGMGDPLLPEDKKALINKNVWCEPCELTEPRRFKIENQYFGTISLDANLYQSVKLRVILDAVAKIPKEQQIFCKIKGIYPDGTFKLQWIVQWNERIRQLVFPNKFFQKIDIETEKRDKKQALIGTETWGIIKKNTGRNIVAIKDIYPAVLGEEDVLQNNLLQCLNRSTTVLCKVLSLENDGLFRIKWLFPEPSIFPDFTDTSSLEQRIGEEVWAEIKWIFSNKVIAWVEGKYLAIILGNGVLKAKYVHQILQKMFNVQVLCRIADVKNNVMQLEWLIDKNSDFLQNSSISQMDRNILSDILVEMEKTKNKKELKKGKKEKRRERQVEEQNKIREMMQEEEKMEIEEIEIEMEIEEEENKIRETLQIKEEMEMKRKERKKEKDKERKKGKRMKRREEKIEGQNKIREMMQTKEEIEEEIVPWEKQETESIKMETPILKPLTIVGKVDLDAINEKTKPRKKPKEELRKEQAERYRLEKEKQKTLKDLRAEKRKEKGEEDWKTKRKREKIDKKQNIEQAQLITENKTYLEQQYVGKTLWLELHKTRSMLIEFWIEGKYKAKMSISEKIYPNASCQNIKRALNESVEGQQFLCEVLEICPNCLTLRWKIEEDPLAKKYSVISGDFPEIEDKPQQMDETKSEENTEKQKKTFNIRNWFKW